MRRPGPKRLATPIPATVHAERSGYPHTIDGATIEAVRESWLVEDRWWAPTPIRRRYWEVVTRNGQNLVLFRDLQTGEWFRQASLS
ncbi:MAG: hypothetical protein JHD16_09215 [Solirubrobacteraceae bacterium]|nr:hypothetical protein [Solirubrobacteraceae bacterium]